MLTSAGAGLAAWLLAACGGSTTQPSRPATVAPTAPPPAPTAPAPAASAAPAPSPTTTLSASPAQAGGRLLGYAFGAARQDVTIFDVAARRVLATQPLGATVRWLSNEQRFWDGRYIWTYDHPGDRVQVIALDPRSLSVARTIPTGGKGPAHSLMLTMDRKAAWVNLAGDDQLALIDLASGQVAAQVKTGKFP